jgi:hypothetical protein
MSSPFNPGTLGSGSSSGLTGTSSQTSEKNPLLPQFLQGNSGMDAHQIIPGLDNKPGNANFNAGSIGGSLHQINTEQSIGHPVDTSQYNGQQTGIVATNTNAQSGGNFSNPFTASGNGAFTNDGFKPSPFMQAAGQNGGKGPFAGSVNSGNGTATGPFAAVGGNTNAGFSENTLPNPFQTTSGTGGNTPGNGAATSGSGMGANPFQTTGLGGGQQPLFGGSSGAPSSGTGSGGSNGGGNKPNVGGAAGSTGGPNKPNFGGSGSIGGGSNMPNFGGAGVSNGGANKPNIGGSGSLAGGSNMPNFGGNGGSNGGGNKPNFGGSGGFNPLQGNSGSSVGGNKPFGGGSGGGMGSGSPMGGGGNFHAPSGYGGATGGGPMMGGAAGGNPMGGSTSGGTGSKIDVQYVIKKCPDTMHCMTTCPQGYRLGGDGKDGCPLCTCLGKQGEIMQGLPHQNTIQGLGNLHKGKKTGKQTEHGESKYS